jgi:hypothetical protein
MIIRSRRLSRGWRNRPTTIQATSAFPGAPTSPKWKSTLIPESCNSSTTRVDDVGTVINPMIVEGQLHGGIVQGTGQALYENCVYDSASGQLLSGSFMDYCMPRAENLPTLRVSTHSTPSAHTPMVLPGHPAGCRRRATLARCAGLGDGAARTGRRVGRGPACSASDYAGHRAGRAWFRCCDRDCRRR